jgi:hypothetical protein
MTTTPQNTTARADPRSAAEVHRQLADLAKLRDAARAYGTPDFASRAGLDAILGHERSLLDELRAAELLEAESTLTAMTKTLHGTAHGKTIELDEDLGVPEGQSVQVQVTIVPSVAPPMGEGLAKVYAVLGERFHSDENDAAARHNEHQP